MPASGWPIVWRMTRISAHSLATVQRATIDQRCRRYLHATRHADDQTMLRDEAAEQLLNRAEWATGGSDFSCGELSRVVASLAGCIFKSP
jgi:hypothetical protein